MIWRQLAWALCIIPFWQTLLVRYTCTIDFSTQGRNLMYHSIWPTILGRHTCTIELVTLGRGLMYHSNLANDLRQPCLYKWFELTRQELNVSFLSDQTSQAELLVQDLITLGTLELIISFHFVQCPYVDIHVQVIRSHLAGSLIISFWAMLFALGRN